MRGVDPRPASLREHTSKEGVHHLETDASVLVARPPGRRPGGPKGPVAGGGIVLRGPDLEVVETRSLLLGPIESPTHAEYAALLAGLKVARQRGVEHLRIRNDNTSLVRHLTGQPEGVADDLLPVVQEIGELRTQFLTFDLRWAASSHAALRRDGLPTADLLARQAIGLGPRLVRRRRGRG
jgi:ribonuclease HI